MVILILGLLSGFFVSVPGLSFFGWRVNLGIRVGAVDVACGALAYSKYCVYQWGRGGEAPMS